MIIVEIFRWNHNLKLEKLSLQKASSTMAEIIHLVAIFLFGAACSQLATDFGKYTIGRLRYEKKTIIALYKIIPPPLFF